jgi:hypothetical protein
MRTTISQVFALVNLILTKRYALHGRAKTAKRSTKPAKYRANHFQKPDSYPGFYGTLNIPRIGNKVALGGFK